MLFLYVILYNCGERGIEGKGDRGTGEGEMKEKEWSDERDMTEIESNHHDVLTV